MEEQRTTASKSSGFRRCVPLFLAALVTPGTIIVFYIYLWSQSGNTPAAINDVDRVYAGKEARVRIATQLRHDIHIPESASDFYLWDGGTFNGNITYWALSCASIEDCWRVVLSDKFTTKDKFKPWEPSEFAVVMYGPKFYGKKMETPKWDVSAIRNGVVYEYADEDCRRLEFYAIDFDRRRVYHHYESGGFPCDKVSEGESPN